MYFIVNYSTKKVSLFCSLDNFTTSRLQLAVQKGNFLHQRKVKITRKTSAHPLFKGTNKIKLNFSLIVGTFKLGGWEVILFEGLPNNSAMVSNNCSILFLPFLTLIIGVDNLGPSYNRTLHRQTFKATYR